MKYCCSRGSKIVKDVDDEEIALGAGAPASNMLTLLEPPSYVIDCSDECVQAFLAHLIPSVGIFRLHLVVRKSNGTVEVSSAEHYVIDDHDIEEGKATSPSAWRGELAPPPGESTPLLSGENRKPPETITLVLVRSDQQTEHRQHRPPLRSTVEGVFSDLRSEEDSEKELVQTESELYLSSNKFARGEIVILRSFQC
jgi:hypothetical protein